MMAKASMVFHAGGRTVASIGNRSPAGRRGRRVFLATQFRREPVRVTTPVACPFPARSRAAAGVMAARGERLSTQWQVTEHLRSDAVLWLADQQHIAHSLHRQSAPWKNQHALPTIGVRTGALRIPRGLEDRLPGLESSGESSAWTGG